MIRRTLILAGLLFTGSLWAAKTPPNQNLLIQIQHGELATQFKVDAGANTLSMANSQGLKKSRKIGKDDVSFLVSEALKLSTATKRLPPECRRAQMAVTIGSGKTAKYRRSCFGLKSITSKSYQDLANLLAVEI